ncbi:uncharacterized protein DS421_10g310530 [Arachis hypogaea]|nr:uncharacterized protein DS421_10g310530 [Arachis hypogaea]
MVGEKACGAVTQRKRRVALDADKTKKKERCGVGRNLVMTEEMNRNSMSGVQ